MEKTKGVKRIQISVYLTPETHDRLLALSSATHESVSDMIAKSAEEFARKNAETAEQIKAALQGFTVEY